MSNVHTELLETNVVLAPLALGAGAAAGEKLPLPTTTVNGPARCTLLAVSTEYSASEYLNTQRRGQEVGALAFDSATSKAWEGHEAANSCGQAVCCILACHWLLAAGTAVFVITDVADHDFQQ